MRAMEKASHPDRIQTTFLTVRVSLRRPAVITSAVESTTAAPAPAERTRGISEDAKPPTRSHEALNCATSEEQARGEILVHLFIE